MARERSQKPSVIALLLVTAAALFLAGAFLFPFMHSEFALSLPGWMPDPLASRFRLWLIDKGRIPVGDQYLWALTRNLFTAREYLIGLAILLFSVVFPVLKIVLCGLLATESALLPRRLRTLLLRFLRLSVKWSMADVFIVGMIIVFFKAEGFHFAFEARAGVYCYATSAVISAIAVTVVQRLHWDVTEQAGRLRGLADDLDRTAIAPLSTAAMKNAAEQLRVESAIIEERKAE